MSQEQRTYVITGSASGIGFTTKEYLESQGHRVIGADLRDAEVIADISNTKGREALVRQVTELSSGTIDAVLAVAGVDAAGPATVSVNYYGAIATLEGLRSLLLNSSTPRAVAVSSITSVHPYDQQMLNMLLNGTEEQAKRRATVAEYAYATSKRALSMWIRRTAISAEWAEAGIPLNAIAPGLVRTALLSRLFDDPAVESRIRAGTPMPLKGPYEPIAAAHLLAFLAGEHNGHMPDKQFLLMEARTPLFEATRPGDTGPAWRPAPGNVALLRSDRQEGNRMTRDSKADQVLANRLESQRTAAMVANDVELLEELFSSDLIYTHADAHSDSRTSLLQKMRNRSIDYHRIELSPLHLTTFADGLLIHGLAEIDVTVGGIFRKLSLGTSVAWRRESDTWRFVAHLATARPHRKGTPTN